MGARSNQPGEAQPSRASTSSASRNDKVAEIWNHRDDLGLMEQVGAAIYAGARNDD
jgi:hypothetical protein